MVFFTCNHCGESVKKPVVAKHYQNKCKKNDPFLTCVDCLKDFKGNEYEAHTKCLTENEKYSAKGSDVKPTKNKGERKQQAWHECIQTVLMKPTLKADEKDLINAISKYDNVPRKKPKFMNFLANAFKNYGKNNDLIDRVWAEMESVFKDMTAAAEKNRKIERQQKEQQKPPKQDSQKPSQKKVNPKDDENSEKPEKKRKRQAEDDKVADSSDSRKTDDKTKKKKQKPNEENANEVEGNTEMLIIGESESKPGKKSRKRKADESCQTVQNDSVADEAEPGKKKKKKKNNKPAENEVAATPAENAGGDAKAKKRVKKKTKAQGGDGKTDAEVTAPAGAGKTNENANNANNANTNANANANTVKKEKKVKKSENKENCGEKAEPQKTKTNTQADGEKPAPKKKKPAQKTEPANTNGNDDKQEAFDWKATILQVLNEEGKNSRIQLQKLQKRVLQIHCQVLKCENSEKKEKKFLKKLKEMQQIEIDKDCVVLKS